MDLFSQIKRSHEPLAARMRPRRLSEVAGQSHLTGANALLPKLVARNQFGSLIFIGPPGCGKTSLAEAIANETRSRFVRINATTDGTKELRAAIDQAKIQPDVITTLFVDEVHRFNKAQQDQLLPAVEDGTIRLIAATTHNPAFYVIQPLLSRSHLFRLNPVPPDLIADILSLAISDKERGLGNLKLFVPRSVQLSLARFSNGDVRQALNALEAIAIAKDPGSTIEEEDIASFANERQLRYDKDEDGHYDTISAFIKSLRGCDPHATMYYLERMLQSGEDPRFIARRLIIHSSEDVGLADPNAIQIAVAAAQAVEFVGLPEAKFALAHAALYIALAPKSDSITRALAASAEAVAKHPDLPIPSAIRDNHYQKPTYVGEAPLEQYKYSHDYDLNVSGQDYLDTPLRLFSFKDSGDEIRLRELAQKRAALKAIRKQQIP